MDGFVDAEFIVSEACHGPDHLSKLVMGCIVSSELFDTVSSCLTIAACAVKLRVMS